VAVPDDIVLETEPTFADGLESLDPSDDAVLAEGGGDLGAPVPRPDSGPRAIRFAEPEYPEEARRRGLRAEVVVEVEVNEKGRVVDTIVLERYVWDEDTKAPVERLDFGLEEAALAASTRWLFQPAREGGFPVRSRTALTFRFGL
jgi:outer membrane biosynthesis protein TonB